jgi:hypothetical protein
VFRVFIERDKNNAIITSFSICFHEEKHFTSKMLEEGENSGKKSWFLIFCAL